MDKYFSIIIPTLNEEKYLPILLDNLLQQEETDFEVIVVDGKSADQTKAITKKFQDVFAKRKIQLQLFISDQKSAAYQRNLGAKKARGKYLVFFDADLKIQVSYLKNLKSNLIKDNAHFVTTYVKADQKGFFAERIVLVANNILDKAPFTGRQMCYGFNLIIDKKAFFEIGGFNGKINVTDDYDFSLRALNQGYKLKIYKNLFVSWSLRRFRRMGWLESIIFYLKIIFYNFIKGPPKQEIFTYPMGGKVHN